LNFQQNKISDIGIQYLADALKDNKVIFDSHLIS
jgi:hypothetical protein